MREREREREKEVLISELAQRLERQRDKKK